MSHIDAFFFQSVPPSSSSNHRANTTVHVCWHRNTSVGIRDYRRLSHLKEEGFNGDAKMMHPHSLSAEVRMLLLLVSLLLSPLDQLVSVILAVISAVNEC